MKDKEVFIHPEFGKFTYDKFYDILERDINELPPEGAASKVDTLCPECKGYLFSISYGNCECIANCPCGHSSVVYDS